MDEVSGGGSFAQIARREGKSERQIRLLAPLAFVPPVIVRSIINGTAWGEAAADFAKNVPLLWAPSACS